MESNENTKAPLGCMFITGLFVAFPAIVLIGFLVAYLKNPGGEASLENLMVGVTVFLIMGVPALLLARWAKRNPEAAAQKMTGDIFGRSTEEMGTEPAPKDAEIISEGGSLVWSIPVDGVLTSPLPAEIAVPKATGELPQSNFYRIRDCFEEQGLTEEHTLMNFSSSCFKTTGKRKAAGCGIGILIYLLIAAVFTLICLAFKIELGFLGYLILNIISFGIAFTPMNKILSSAKPDIEFPPLGQFAFLVGTKEKLFILPLMKKKFRFECDSVVQIDLNTVPYVVEKNGNVISLTFKGSERPLSLGLLRKDKEWPESKNFSQYDRSAPPSAD